MSSEQDEITSIARTLLGNRSKGGVTVIFDDKQSTCFWDYEKQAMTLSNKVLPQVMWGTSQESFLLTGAVVHEAGHPIYDAALLEKRIAKMKTVSNPQLMKDAMNIINDSGVNYWMGIEWGATVAIRLKALMIVIGKGIVEDLNEAMKKGEPTNPIMVMLAVGNFNATLADLKKQMDSLAEAVRGLVLEGIRCIRQSQTISAWEDKSMYYDELYRILTKLLAAQEQQQGKGKGQGQGQGDGQGQGQGAGDSIPTQMGGNYIVQGGKATQKEAESQAKAAGQGDESEDGEESDGDSDEQSDSARAGTKGGKGKGKDSQKSRSVGYDPNARVETPRANVPKYQQLVAKNQKAIKTILDRLKHDKTITLKRDTYLPSGRIMPAMITRAATLRYPPVNMYQKMRVEEEKEPTRWAIYVDLSGSMSIPETMNALVTLSEVASKYLRDDQFALYVFGDNFLKLKSFYEHYENVKARVGGLTCLGGTCMWQGLEAICDEFLSMPNGHRNRIIIVSDFALDDEDERFSKKLLKQFSEKPKSKVMLLDMSGYGRGLARQFDASVVRGIDELPDRFIEAYIQDSK